MTTDAYASLLAARPLDRFVRYDVDPDRVERVLSRGGDVAWTSSHPFRGVRWVTAVADRPGSAAEVLVELVTLSEAAGDHVHGVTVPWADAARLPHGIAPSPGSRWCWWWTAEAPEIRPGEASTALLAPDDSRIPDLLAHSSSASVRPGDPHVRRWVGVVADGDLLACAAHTEHLPGVPHLASVVTRPDHRGRGLASDLCARLTREALNEGAPVVTLGMYSDNDVARGVYARLGFTVDKDFVSGQRPCDGPLAPILSR
jgi:predicted GNAT family acetyltransferase